jgi:hypothetical protein
MVNKSDIVLIVMGMDYVCTKKERNGAIFAEEALFVTIIKKNHNVLNVNHN